MPPYSGLSTPAGLTQFMRPIGLLIMLSVVAVAAVATFGARELDRLTERRQAELIDNVLSTFSENVGRQVQPLALNHHAAEHVAMRDLTWVRAHFGATMQEMFGYDAVFVLDGANTPLIAQIGREALGPEAFARYQGVAAASMREARAADITDNERHNVSVRWVARADGARVRFVRVSHLERIDAAPALVTAATIISDRVDLEAGAPPLLIVVQTLRAPMLASIGRNFGLEGLRIADANAPKDTALHTLHNEAGAPIATLAWTPDRPAQRLLMSLLPKILPLTLVVLGLGAAVMISAHRCARSSEIARRDAEYRAEHDDLTGQLNRGGFMRRLDEALHPIDGSTARLAIVAIDLDRFKELNDTFGHLQGDAALKRAVERIQAALPDNASLGRLGGDEFIAILPGAGSAEARAIADQMRLAVSEPLSLPCGVDTQLGASLGVALAPLHAQSSYELLRMADVALYRAKALGRGRVVMFDLLMDAEFAERRRIEDALRTALARDEISMLYQPIMSHDGQRVASVEALMRWRSPELGEISPSVFVPIAEESGLISDLGEYALRVACRDALLWGDVKVAVNVSSVQFRQGDFADLVERILAETGLPARLLELEVTETAVIGDEMGARHQIDRLRNLGVSVALDDFGSGYSSLAYLHRFGFDKLKIDQRFVQDLGESDVSATIVHAIVQMGRAMGMQITAEGVETAEQHIFLRAAGCHYMQGFVFARPMSAEDVQVESVRARSVA